MEDTSLEVWASGIDGNGDALTTRITVLPQQGTLHQVGGWVGVGVLSGRCGSWWLVQGASLFALALPAPNPRGVKSPDSSTVETEL